MKNAKKILERKRKIIVVLVVMVSFVSVLAWYQMKKAHAYQSYNTGGNKHFKDGHLTVNINGPNGKSDSLTMYIHNDELFLFLLWKFQMESRLAILQCE